MFHRRSPAVRPGMGRPRRAPKSGLRQLEALEERRLLATFTVANIGDAGPGSLRQAILDANALTGLDAIDFAISGAGVQTIAPQSPLPSIVDPVVIDATTQPGYAGTPIVELAGVNTPAGSNGFQVVALGSGSTIRGFAINRFPSAGIFLAGPGNNLVAGNYIGLDPTGTRNRGNGVHGVFGATGTSNNTIGGTAAADRNVISANAIFGIALFSPSTGNLIQGNYIGTDATGTTATDPDGPTLGNAGGIGIAVLTGTASGNTVGGTAPGAGNLISGNLNNGLQFLGAANTANLVQGNFIGTDVTGGKALPNGASGLFLSGSGLNTIGGATASARNLFSGNGAVGVLIQAGASGNLVQGNYIGIGVDGSADVGNAADGVRIFDSADNTIGGAAAGAGNVISSNGEDGVDIGFAAATGNVVAGNLIGTESMGAAALGNSAMGVRLSGAVGATVGGVTPGARNVISGNLIDGVAIQAGATGNRVTGNFIGTDITGLSALANVGAGVDLFGDSKGNLIGGVGAAERNVISGNDGFGIILFGAGSAGNLVVGNFIGTDATGAASLGNGLAGVQIQAPGNTLGGTSAATRNVISGNAGDGVAMFNAEATNNVVQGNYIGVDATGTAAVGNGGQGLTIAFGAPGNTVGGAAAGEGNVLSGNAFSGVFVTGSPGAAAVIQGNFLGTNAAGTAALANGAYGVAVGTSSGVTIGGPAAGAGNVISGNAAGGVQVFGISAAPTSDVLVAGNRIGTDPAGTAAVGNAGPGVAVLGAATGATIGGAVAGAGNSIAFNAGAGVQVVDDFAVNNPILTNSIFNNQIGIDLGGEGLPTPNSPGGPNVGPNRRQNKPVLTASSSDGSTLVAAGTLNSRSGTTFTLQFFADGGDAAGLGEGRVFVGERAVTTGPDGNVAFNFVRAFPGIPTTSVITATATDPEGNTSEFSLDTIVRNVNDGGLGSLRQAITNANLVGQSNVIRFAIPNLSGGALTIAPSTPLPRLTAPNLSIDGYTQPGARPNTLAEGDDAVLLIALDGSNAGPDPGVDGLTVQGNSATIRGLAIGRFAGAAIGLSGSSSRIVGNFLGLDPSGSVPRPNGVGVVLGAASLATIGGTAAADRNLISGNLGDGVRFFASGAVAGLVVAGNRIGAGRTDAEALGNGGHGVLIEGDFGGPAEALVGGVDPGAANLIAYNLGAGVRAPAAIESAVIRRNRSFANRALGIDIDGEGVTPNRPPTPINDPNRFPNYPALTAATIAPNETRVTGTFDGTTSVLTTLDFFVSDAADPTGFGQGAAYLGSIAFTTDSKGHADFVAILPQVRDGQFLTATATSFATSEFSRALIVVAAIPRVDLTIDATPNPVAVADLLTYTIVARNVGTADVVNVQLTDFLPAPLTAASAAEILARGGSLGNVAGGQPAFVLSLGPVPAGAARSFTFQVTPATAGVLVNSVVARYFVGQDLAQVTASSSTRAIFTFTVLNNNNAGFGSLRQAILNSNANPGVDTVDFRLPGNQLVLSPGTLLPDIADPAVIDAATQPGFAGSPLVSLIGADLPPDPDGLRPTNGLVVTGGGTTIRGLVVGSFADNGIVLRGGSGSRVVNSILRNNDVGLLIRNSAANTVGGTTPAERNVISANRSLGVDLSGGSARNLIAGNFIGLDAAGTGPLGNGLDGVLVEDSPDNAIVGNVISASGEVNVQLFGAASARNVVIGNLIGTDASGSGAASTPGDPTEVGVFVNAAPANTIGGPAASDRNVVSGAGAGIELYRAAASGNVVIGNFVGTDRSGTRPIPNTIGIFLFDAPGNAVVGNVASGNAQVGIRLDGVAATGNRVAGNVAGLDASATAALPNGSDGVFLSGAPGNTIGGLTPGEANVLTGNRSVGLQIFGEAASGNLVLGNLIGAAPNGTEPGNGLVGVFLNDAPRNTVGGTTPGASNLVAGNRRVGIQVSGRSAVGNVILGNMVRDNAEIGIASENAEGNTIGIAGPGANVVTGSEIAFRPVPAPGPTVTVVAPRRAGATLAGVAITFNTKLAPGRARDRRAYRVEVLDLRGRRVGTVLIRSALYDYATSTVALTFARAVPARRSYRLIALGEGPRALTDAAGRRLDGAARGDSGTNFAGRFGGLAATVGPIATRTVPTFRRAATAARGLRIPGGPVRTS